MAKSILGYWDIRGLAESIRLMLDYCGVDYEDKRYVAGDLESWHKDQFELGLDFPNLPYYIDGDVKVTESVAIMKYIARKHGLVPDTEASKRKIDIAEGVVGDFRVHFVMTCYMPAEFEKNKAIFFQRFAARMEIMDKYLENNRWLAGDDLSYMDFVFCEWLSQVLLLDSKCLEKFSNTTKYYDNFFKLDKIAAYRNSKKFRTFPVHSPNAQWGGSSKDE